jgi:hypothetical protein
MFFTKIKSNGYYYVLISKSPMKYILLALLKWQRPSATKDENHFLENLINYHPPDFTHIYCEGPKTVHVRSFIQLCVGGSFLLSHIRSVKKHFDCEKSISRFGRIYRLPATLTQRNDFWNVVRLSVLLSIYIYADPYRGEGGSRTIWSRLWPSGAPTIRLFNLKHYN